MQVSCPRCSRVLEYTGERPSFCAYCGQPLAEGGSGATGVVLEPAMAATVAVTPAETAAVVRPPAIGRGEPAPEWVARYRLIRPLGTGGMGTVYEAEDSDFGRRVAVKLIAADSATSSAAVERFRQEGRLASAIAHPRCVFVLAADEADGRPYIVMELMPGSTLQTLVEERGPLPVEEAIAKILDVIEGLQEAHSLGVIHRDVKPSNCFLESDGRVKVGDFGLAKSLTGDVNLTHTRTFLGTPLYASPEQIKGEPLDARTDVYSTAATLYDLLAGRPPFFEGDATAVLARIVSEPAPPLRGLRPELPAALEAAVARGLERDRERRWRDMGEFRAALLPLAPSRLPSARLPLRALAFLVDCALFPLLIEFVFFVTVAGFAFDLERTIGNWRRGLAITLGLSGAAWVPYFAVLEGVWGRSVGKRMAGLRVLAEVGGGPPGVGRSLLRTLVVFLFLGLPADLALWVFRPESSLVRLLVFIGAAASGALALLAAFRVGGWERGPQDWLTGTRVVRAEVEARKRAPRARRVVRSERLAPLRAVGVLETVGPFRIRGAVRWEPNRKVLVGEDATLGRQVWIVLRPRSAAPPDSARRTLSRPTRTRWLSGGEQAEGRWDAFVPPAGCPLADLAGRDGLPWREARPILHDLAVELSLACADRTLPERLAVEQVWVQPDGSVQLVDALAPPPAPSAGSGTPGSERERALGLLREAAALALEGGRRRTGAPVGTIRAAVPGYVAQAFDRLLKSDAESGGVEAFLRDLEATRDRPTEVTVGRKAVHLGLLAAALAPGVAWLAFFSFVANRVASPVVGMVAAWPAAWIIWALLTRGGLLAKLAGIRLVCSDGQRASPLRCACRAAFVWLPITVLLLLSVWLRSHGFSWSGHLLWSFTLLSVPVYVLLALLDPPRSPLDRLVGTHQEPV